MTVYIEYVVINNLIIDYFLLKASFHLSGIPVGRIRLFLCAFLGAGFALLYPLLSVNALLLSIIKIAFGLLMVLLCARFKSLRVFVITSTIFFSYTFLVGGAIIGVYNLFGLDYNNQITVAVIAFPVCLIINGLSKVVRYVYKRKDVESFIYDVEVSLDGVAVRCKGFMDTGNGLYDGKNPVIVCDKEFAKRFISPRIKIKKILVNTVNGRTENIAFELSSLKIYQGDKSNIYNNVTLCVSNMAVGTGYELILHPALFKEGKDEQVNVKVKKVS